LPTGWEDFSSVALGGWYATGGRKVPLNIHD
jgi:hypothetical protein